MKKIKELEELAMDMVGDGKSPNLFFISTGGAIVGVVRDEEVASAYAHGLGEGEAVLIEDRQTGTVWENRTSAKLQSTDE